MKSLYVINSNNERESFSFQKIYNSAIMAGASRESAKKIIETIKKEVYPGIKTSEIFQKVKRLLRREDVRVSLRFNLKEGMRRLGPSGFPFEKFIGEVFTNLGFEVKTNQYLPGFCLDSYEIDFLAQKNNLIYVGECKYRNFLKERVHSRDALTNYARFLDILKGPYFKQKKYKNFQIKTMMVTNTKFSSQAMKYSRCMKVDLLGWKYPRSKSLENLIEKQGLYPITILPSLRGFLKDILISKEIMLVKDILDISPERFAREFKIPPKQSELLIKEASILLG